MPKTKAKPGTGFVLVGESYNPNEWDCKPDLHITRNRVRNGEPRFANVIPFMPPTRRFFALSEFVIDAPKPKRVETPPATPLMLETSATGLAPTVEIAAAYQAIYDYWNREIFEKLFGQPLPRCVLNLSRQKGAVAVFYANSWKDLITGDMLDEISLVPEWVNRDVREVMSSLVHEMCHFKDKLDGTVSKTPGYHGRSWFRIMKRVGLPGRALSKSMLKVTHDIDPDGEFQAAFDRMPRKLVLPFITARTMVRTVKVDSLSGKRAKYECPVCGLSMRGASQRNIKCEDCDQHMMEVGF